MALVALLLVGAEAQHRNQQPSGSKSQAGAAAMQELLHQHTDLEERLKNGLQDNPGKALAEEAKSFLGEDGARFLGALGAAAQQLGRQREDRQRAQQEQQRAQQAQQAQLVAPVLVGTGVAQPGDILCAQLLSARNFTRLIMDAHGDPGVAAFAEKTTSADGTEDHGEGGGKGAGAEQGGAGAMLRRIFRGGTTTAAASPEVIRNRDVMRRVNLERRRTLCTALDARPDVGRLALKAREGGMQLSSYGMDLTKLYGALRLSMPNEPTSRLSSDLRVQAARALYLGDTDWTGASAFEEDGICEAGMRFTGEFNRRFFEEDTPARFPTRSALQAILRDNSNAATMYGNLRRDGFLKVDQFAAIDMAEIERLARLALNEQMSKNPGRHVWTAAPHALDGPLRRIFYDDGLWLALRAYLAPHLRDAPKLDTDFYWTAQRVSADLNDPQLAIDSFYHHDGCGRQLKLYLYLDDVPEFFGRATRVVQGTHNTNYYSNACYLDSRLSEEWVAQHFGTRVTRMAGRRGGGFVFDTNALHRMAWEKPVQRDVIIIQMIAPGKCPRIKQPEPSAHTETRSPCPERLFRPFEVNTPEEANLGNMGIVPVAAPAASTMPPNATTVPSAAASASTSAP